jgi:dTDP-4-amino-4,6-dideoxygalactose transaminase
VSALAAPRPAARFIVPHARPWIGLDEEAAALRVLRSGRLAPGAEAARLEGLVTRLAGAADAVAVGSGTLAMTLALRALGVGPGDQVALPAYGCAALLHGVRGAGARPLVCDIDPLTLALDPDDVRRRARASLGALIVVHPFGWPVPLEPYRALGVPILEDCAQSPGASLASMPVGARGDASIFSFGPTKLVTCGGPGGAVAAPVPALVREVRDLASHDEREHDRPRVNGLLGDLHAAIAAVQVGRLGEIVTRRRAIAARYDTAFADLPAGRRQAAPGVAPVFHRYLLRTAGGAAAILAGLQAAGISARHPVHRPLHRVAEGAGGCPAADEAHDRWISLPISPAFTEREVRQVIGTVRECLS